MSSIVIAFYNVFPPISGAASVSYNTAKFMTGKKMLLHIDRIPSEYDLEKGFHVTAFPCRTETHLTKVLDLFRAMPRMARAIRRLDPDVVVLEGASWAVYYWLFFRLLEFLNVKTRVVYHAHNVEYLLRSQRNNSFVAWLTRRAEGALLRRCHLCTSVSDEDALHFERLYRVSPLILPNGVDPDKFDRVTPSEVQAVKSKYGLVKQTVLFMGLTAFPPNQEAIRFLVQDIFPRVIQNRPKAKLVIIGGDVDIRRNWLINPGSIPFDEVPAFIKACDLCVAPIFSGSGTRLKILEYMAAGKPVVATPKGAEGIHCRDGYDILLAQDAEQFADRICHVLSHSRSFQKIAAQGRRTVAKDYSWRRILASFQRRVAEF